MSTNYKDLELSSSQIRLLKKIKLLRKVSRKEIEKCKTDDSHNRYNFLFKYSLIDYADREHQFYTLSDKALMYLRYIKKR